MHRKVSGMVVAVVLMLGVAGCGDDSLTKAEFVRKATATCKSAERTSGLQSIKNKDRDAMIDYAKSLVTTHRKLVDDLDEIEPPSELAADYDGYLAALRKQDALLGKVLSVPADLNGDGTVKPNTPTAEVSHEHDVTAHKAFLLAKKLDLQACGG